jgi:hypothetical protein
MNGWVLPKSTLGRTSVALLSQKHRRMLVNRKWAKGIEADSGGLDLSRKGLSLFVEMGLLWALRGYFVSRAYS